MAKAATIGGFELISADRLLKWCAALWFVIALVGQWTFGSYITLVYGGSALRGDFAAWRHTSLRGYAPGDTAGNLVFASHVLMAAIVVFSGALQLVPQIRARALNLHRWNGRLFLIAACAASLGGLYLVWIRGVTTLLVSALGISLDAGLILTFAALALRSAWAHDVMAHRRWALRTLILAGGVWFQRLGYMAWVILNHGPVGMTDKLDGPFDIFVGFASFLLPLAALELYLRAQAGGARRKYAMAACLFALTTLMGIGIAGAAAMMWGPPITHALAAT